MDRLFKDNHVIIKVTDSFNSHKRKSGRNFGKIQLATKKWLSEKLDESDITDLIFGKDVGITVKKGRGFSHVTLKRRLKQIKK